MTTTPAAVQHVYEKDCESRLKELFVFAARRSIDNEKIAEERFQDVALNTPDFGLAMFLTQLQSQLQVTCQVCEKTSDLVDCDCSCGFRGFCSEDCKDTEWKDLECCLCDARNSLVLNDNQNVWVEGKLVNVATAQKEHGWHPMSGSAQAHRAIFALEGQAKTSIGHIAASK